MNVKDKLNLYFKPNAVEKSLHQINKTLSLEEAAMQLKQLELKDKVLQKVK